MKIPFYLLILVCIFSCKSTKIVSESNTESESIFKKIELELDVVLSEQEFEKMSGKASR